MTTHLHTRQFALRLIVPAAGIKTVMRTLGIQDSSIGIFDRRNIVQNKAFQLNA